MWKQIWSCGCANTLIFVLSDLGQSCKDSDLIRIRVWAEVHNIWSQIPTPCQGCQTENKDNIWARILQSFIKFINWIWTNLDWVREFCRIMAENVFNLKCSPIIFRATCLEELQMVELEYKEILNLERKQIRWVIYLKRFATESTFFMYLCSIPSFMIPIYSQIIFFGKCKSGLCLLFQWLGWKSVEKRRLLTLIIWCRLSGASDKWQARPSWCRGFGCRWWLVHDC